MHIHRVGRRTTFRSCEPLITAWLLLPLLILIWETHAFVWQNPLGLRTPRHRPGPAVRIPFIGQFPRAVRGDTDHVHGHYTITYSPNFNRHLVSYEIRNGTRSKKVAVRSFLWLDEALEAYPNAKLEPLDPPPTLSSLQEGTNKALQLSRIVAGAGVNESSVYYNDGPNTNDVQRGSPALNPNNNGGAYLYRFLQKFYATLPTISPAQIHRGVMDKFPKLAFYDAQWVHERLFFLLSPLPPDDAFDNLKAVSTDGTRRRKAGNGTNASSCFDDFPVLFHKYGYGVGLSKVQLAQALQSLPQYWLPMYLGDALASTRKPQDVVPYILYNLNSHPTAFKEATEDLDHLLTGTAWGDMASIAHAKSSLGLTEHQCLVLLHAFPTLRTCDTEPNWEFFQRGPVRPVLMEESLAYLRLRLQLDPVQIFGLIKTHTRLSSYTVNGRLKPFLDTLQSELGLQSKELQQLILRMPSLLGMSDSSLAARKHFFLDQLGMEPEQLKTSVLKHPALLQYSISNLESKPQFFRESLHIKDDLILKMLVRKPRLWGLSTEDNLKPKAANFGDFCGLSSSEVGEVFSRAPELLLFNFKGNLEPKLLFLVDRLDLDAAELKSFVVSSARPLAYSLHGSLSPKISMLEEHLSENPELGITTKDLLLERPTLLTMGSAALLKTMSRMTSFNLSSKGSEPALGFATGRRSKVVLELSTNGTILSEFASVKDAAAFAGTSVYNMNNVLREGTVFCERKYSFGGRRRPSQQEPVASVSVNAQLVDAVASTVHGQNVTDCGDDSIATHSRTIDVAVQLEQNDNRWSVYVSGRVYPPDDASQARGGRRVGGMAVAMPFSSKTLTALFEQALKEGVKPQLLGSKRCQIEDQLEGLVALIGYSNLGPSRRRCGLYACFVALQVMAQLCTLIDKHSKAHGLTASGEEESCPPMPKHIDIVTDSSYVYDLLKDSGKVWEWGCALSPDQFVYTGRGSKWFANTDLIYGLSRAYHKLVDPRGARSVTVSFVLKSGDTDPVEASKFRKKMGSWGTEAARLFYERAYG